MSMFEKVLRAFENGDLPFTYVQSELKRLLASGESAQKLLETMQRRELIEPLPEYAHDEILRVLNEAIEAAAAASSDASSATGQASGASGDKTSPTDEASSREARPASVETVRLLHEEISRQKAGFVALSRARENAEDIASAATARAQTLSADLIAVRTALGVEQTKNREMAKAMAEKSALSETARVQLEIMQQESERLQVELKAVRDELAARDTALAQERQALAGATTARSALAVEQTKNRDLAKALAEKTAHSETVRSQLETARQEAERLRSEVKKLRDDLAARDASLAQERQALAGAATARSALAVEQTKNRDLAKALAEKAAQVDTARSQLETSRSQVDTARSQVEIARQDSGRLQAELKTARDAIAASDASLVQERQALAAALARATALDAELRAAPMQAKTVATYWRPEFDQNRTYELEPPEELEPANEPVAAQLRESKHAAQILESSSPLGAPPNVGLIRALCVGLVALMLAVLFWSFVHHSLSAAKAPVVPAAPPAAGAVVRDCATCPPLTVLPAGQFLQGSGGTASGVRPNETPQHWVAIARSFAMSTNPVTVDEFRAFVASTGRQMQGCDTYDGDWRVRPENSWQNPGFVQTGSHPVTCASWEDAKAYAAWLSARTGHRYRLPSASEWEYAARAGSGAIRPWAADGSDACVSANVADASAARQFPGWTVFACDDGYVNTAPVGSFKANAFGLNDMLGNVFQWTEDCWHADYTGAPIDGSARTDGDCSEHELRGGSWFTSPDLVRANYRNHFAAAYRTSSVGIRLVRDLEP